MIQHLREMFHEHRVISEATGSERQKDKLLRKAHFNPKPGFSGVLWDGIDVLRNTLKYGATNIKILKVVSIIAGGATIIHGAQGIPAIDSVVNIGAGIIWVLSDFFSKIDKAVGFLVSPLFLISSIFSLKISAERLRASLKFKKELLESLGPNLEWHKALKFLKARACDGEKLTLDGLEAVTTKKFCKALLVCKNPCEELVTRLVCLALQENSKRCLFEGFLFVVALASVALSIVCVILPLGAPWLFALLALVGTVAVVLDILESSSKRNFDNLPGFATMQ